MNLYRNFGNLFENWVSEGCLDLKTGAGLDGFDFTRSDSLSRNFISLSNLKSESEDSGFETVSTTSPCHSHREPQFTDPENVSPEDDVQPPSPALSVYSSSSSCVSLGSVAPRKTCLEVEQALRRTEQTSGYFKNRGSLNRMESGLPGPLYRCYTASFPSSCHTTNSRVHQLTRARRTYSQPQDLKKAELYRRLKSQQYGQPVVNQLEFEEEEQQRLEQLSPGLLYLEQVCKMLESFARLQQQNHNLQKEVELLKSQHAETECAQLNESEIDSHEDQEDSSSLSTFSEEPATFRHRSVSDTQASLSRHSRAGFAQDEYFAGVLFKKPGSVDSPPEHDSKKSSKIQKLKLTSLKRQETQRTPQSKSDQLKKKTKLPNIFRNRTMTTRL